MAKFSKQRFQSKFQRFIPLWLNSKLVNNSHRSREIRPYILVNKKTLFVDAADSTRQTNYWDDFFDLSDIGSIVFGRCSSFIEFIEPIFDIPAW